MSLEDIYREVILDHYQRPRNRGQLENPTTRKFLRNPTCGDEMEIQLDIADGKVTAARWHGRGCSISMASASMMTEALQGKTPAEAEELIELFLRMMQGEPDSYRQLGELQSLQGVSKLPVRIKCATLAWHAAQEGLAQTGAG